MAKRTDAERAYKAKRREVLDRLTEIRAEIESRRPAKADWSHVGSLGYAEERLAEVLAFLEGR